MQLTKTIYKHCSAVLKPIMLMCCIAVVAFSAMIGVEATAKTVSIIDSGKTTTVHTFSTDAKNILDTAGISLGDNDGYTMSDFSEGKATLTVNRAFDVDVSLDGEVTTVSLTGGTVADAIEAAGIDYDDSDIVSHTLTTRLSAGMKIDITNVTYNTVEELVSVPYTTKVVYSDKLAAGTTKTTGGENGYKLVTYTQTIVDGQVTNTQVVSETVVKAAVPATKTVGTKKAASTTQSSTANKVQSATNSKTYLTAAYKYVSSLKPGTDFELNSKGIPTQYKKLITGKASAYSGGGYTATGKHVRTGYVAVNPKQIPYGSKLFIRCSDGSYIYGYAVAEDTGGFINWGTRVIDLYFSTESACIKFGVRNVEIYVL